MVFVVAAAGLATPSHAQAPGYVSVVFAKAGLIVGAGGGRGVNPQRGAAHGRQFVSAKAVDAHLRYLERDGVTKDGEKGQVYSAERDVEDGRAFLDRGRDDRHQFRFIVSAENGAELSDPRETTRNLMKQMETDLGTKLDWIRRVKNDFAISTLVRCGHCGSALTGDIKKGRYIYYRCTGYKGRCPEPFVPEAVLSRKFSEVLCQLDIGEAALQLVSEGLKSSHLDQAKEHAEAIKRLQAEYDRIQAMYVDKLDGKVDPGMFEHLFADWRKQQDRCLREIEQRQSADQHDLEEGVSILEMARNAQRLFDGEEPMEKRRLLNFVVSNSTWANGELNATLREPLGLLLKWRSLLPAVVHQTGQTSPIILVGWGTRIRT